MSGNALDALLDRCPFRSVIGAHGSDLGRQPGAVIAAPDPGGADPAPEALAAAVDILLSGGTVLILTADAADRHRIRALLAAARPAQWGHA